MALCNTHYHAWVGSFRVNFEWILVGERKSPLDPECVAFRVRMLVHACVHARILNPEVTTFYSLTMVFYLGLVLSLA